MWSLPGCLMMRRVPWLLASVSHHKLVNAWMCAPAVSITHPDACPCCLCSVWAGLALSRKKQHLLSAPPLLLCLSSSPQWCTFQYVLHSQTFHMLGQYICDRHFYVPKSWLLWPISPQQSATTTCSAPDHLHMYNRFKHGWTSSRGRMPTIFSRIYPYSRPHKCLWSTSALWS